MGDYKSQYSLNQEIKFVINSTIFIGKIKGIIFTANGIFYDIEVADDIHRSVPEDLIEK